MPGGKFRVLVRMIRKDNVVGKWKVVDPATSGVWSKKSIYVLCDASAVQEVVQLLSVE